MTTLFDHEKVLEIEKYNIANEAKQEGQREERAALVKRMLGISIFDVSEMTGISTEEIEQLMKQ